MRKLPPPHIPHTFRLGFLSALLAAALTLILATAGPTVAAGSGCGFVLNCDVSELGANSVILEPTISTNDYETRYKLEYATAESGPWSPVPGGSGLIAADEGEKTLHVELTGLSPETTYHVRGLTENEQGNAEIGAIEFTTEGLAPRAVGTTVISTTETSAQVQGELKPHLETRYKLEYATGDTGPWTAFASGTLPASDKLQSTPAEALTGLSPETTYYVREFLTNEHGDDTSPAIRFETASPPSIDSESVSNVGEHDATLEAEINPNGLETTYELWLEYANCQNAPPRTASCASISGERVGLGHIAAGSADQTVGAELDHLHPGYSYTYWVTAINSAGEVAGAHKTFKALTEPPVIDGESVSGVTEHDGTLQAEINPEGQAVRYQFQIAENASEFASEIVCPTAPSSELCLENPVTGALPIGFIESGYGDQFVSLDLASAGMTLQPGTTYHYRVIAARSVQTEDTIQWKGPPVYGPDQTFTTSSSRARPLGGETEPTGGGAQSGASSATGQGESSGTPGEKSPGSSGKTVSPKVLTRAQKLAKALKQCKKEPKRKQAECKQQAHKKYAPVAKKKNKKK